MARECFACHEVRDDVKARATPDGDAGDLCGACWADVAGQWPTRRDA